MEVLFVLAIYMVPTIVALSRDMPNKGSTIAVNILLGWTLVGWVIALAMALGDATHRGAQVIVQTNFAAGPMGNPMVAPPTTSRRPQAASNGVIWDHARQAYLYQDPHTFVWMIQSVDGSWLPLPQFAHQRQSLPPPRQPVG